MGINSKHKKSENSKFLSEALTAHAKWKTRLTRFSDGEGEKLNPEDVCKDNLCPLGKWIHGDGAGFSSHGEFGEMKARHAEFHRCAGEIASKVVAGDKIGAERDLTDESSAFNRVSREVGEAIHRFKDVLMSRRQGLLCDLSIRAKLRFVLWSLIGTLLFHVGWVVNENYATWQTMTATASRMEAAAAVGEVVHRLQAERGRTAGFMQSGGGKFKEDLQAARVATDEKIALLKNLDVQQEALQSAIASLGSQAGHRERVSGLSIKAGEATGWYTETIATLLKAVTLIGNSAGEAEIMRKATAYVMFMEGKERSGQERALMTAVYTAGHFDMERYAKWRELLSAEHTYLSAFALYGSEAGRAKLKNIAASDAFTAVENIRRDAQARMAESSLGTTPDDWFKAATMRIDGLHEVENAIAEEIQNIAVNRAAHAQNVLTVTAIVGLAVALILGWTSRWIANGVTEMVGGLTNTIQEVARTGDLSKRVPITTNDETGKAGKAFNDMLDEFQALFAEASEVMRAVARGRFRPMASEARGDFNDLKTGVNSAVNKLQQTMNALHEVMAALAAGDFSKRMNAATEGEIKAAVDRAMQVIQSMLGDVGKVMSGVAQGELTRRVTADGQGELLALKNDINRSLDALSSAMGAISANTRQVAAAANQSSSAIGQISDGAQNQMHAINQVANAVRQTVTSVTDVSNNTEAASKKSQESVAIVRDGKVKMERMVAVVNNIAANSEKIDKITEVIEKIANKTNLLSLNAAIEAARAGEHGKGFAVVAEEVGKLAANSAESTKEIALLVQQAVAEANRAVETVKEVSADMNRIEEGSMQSDAMLQRISAALEQQSAAVQEINANVANLNRVAESNAAASEEITATVVELSKIADNTRREVEKFSV